ncbi:MAG TPA: hypothetical protein VG144_01975 [Gaiellaceae bacterium]|nr:hypothetical protein [Gaiellaceae bacterium]
MITRGLGILLVASVATAMSAPAQAIHVTALGSDSATKLYAGFTSISVERKCDRWRYPVVASSALKLPSHG